MAVARSPWRKRAPTARSRKTMPRKTRFGVPSSTRQRPICALPSRPVDRSWPAEYPAAPFSHSLSPHLVEAASGGEEKAEPRSAFARPEGYSWTDEVLANEFYYE